MTQPPRWVFVGLIVVLTGVLVLWRVGSTTYGRNVSNLVNLRDSSQMRSLKTVGDFEESGELSLYEGTDILNFFRIQIPINPYIYSQAQQMDIRADLTYAITQNPELFRLIRSNLTDVHVYEDARNIVYEGVRLPNAYVFETRRSTSDLRQSPLPVLRDKDRSTAGYLHVRSPRDWRMVNAMATVPAGLSLIVNPGIEVDGLSTKRVQQLGGIHVIGHNARFISSDDPIPGDRLSVVDVQVNLNLDGWVPPMPSWFHGLILLGIAVSLLFLGGTTAAWFSWFAVWALSLTLVDTTHGFVVGMFGGAILDRVIRGRFHDVLWFLLWPMLVYGMGYGSFLAVPLSVEISWFFVGLVVSTFVFFPSVYFRFSRTLRVGDCVVVGLIGLIGFLFWEVPTHSALPAELGGLTRFELILLSLIPACVPLVSGKVDSDVWFWLVPMFLWGTLMLYPGGLQFLLTWPLVTFCYVLGRGQRETNSPAWLQ